MPDDWYRKKYGPWPEVGSAYFRPVTVTELVAVHWHNQGNDLRAARDLAAAEAAYARAAHESSLATSYTGRGDSRRFEMFHETVDWTVDGIGGRIPLTRCIN